MTDACTLNRNAFVDSLESAFPVGIRSDVIALATVIQPSITHSQGIAVNVLGEAVTIPYQILHGFDESLFQRLSDIQALIYACVLSRHHDGRVRERQVERLTKAHEPWVAPFVVELCGAYVMEVLQAVEKRLPLMNRQVYGEFFRRNPAYLDLAHHRMVSYWDCYYRGLYKRKEDYVGFRLFALFREWETGTAGT